MFFIFCYFFVFISYSNAQETNPAWSGNVFFGLTKTDGNTTKGSGSVEAQAIRKIHDTELTLRGHVLYSETNHMMDGQKWDALAKYSFDFGHDKKWYNFYQVFVGHDFFADIDYRITPSTGLGYHILKSEDWT